MDPDEEGIAGSLPTLPSSAAKPPIQVDEVLGILEEFLENFHKLRWESGRSWAGGTGVEPNRDIGNVLGLPGFSWLEKELPTFPAPPQRDQEIPEPENKRQEMIQDPGKEGKLEFALHP